MKIAVIGLWHLGLVTAGCLAKMGHDILAYDPNEALITSLKKQVTPIFEPGLDELLAENYQTKKIVFTSQQELLSTAEIIWITFDTPIDQNDHANIDTIMQQIPMIFPYLQNQALVMISSQLPVGSTQLLSDQCRSQFPDKKIEFCYSPENLRLGRAIQTFSHPDRIVVGLNNANYREKIAAFLKPISENIVWMSVLSAEMTKHAINSFLALSVTFINELASLCETVGADASEVEQGLKTERRIGPNAYLHPGNAIAGGTLMRDINYLLTVASQKNRDAFLLSAVVESNRYHQQWSCRRLLDLFKKLQGKTFAILGLTYKAGTDTLRRSTAIEICQWLYQQGCKIQAYDPVISSLPQEIGAFINIKANAQDALLAADGAIISTEWPQFKALNADDFVNHMKQPLLLDASGFTANTLGNDERIKYFTVGDPDELN